MKNKNEISYINEFISSLYENYNYLEIEKIDILQRDRIDYSVLNSRKVFKLIDKSGNKYILKYINNSRNTVDLNLIFNNLKLDNFSNTIYPIKNNFGGYKTNFYGGFYLLFPEYNLEKTLQSDIYKIIDIYSNLYISINKYNVNSSVTDYINNIKYFLQFSKKTKKYFSLILKKLDIEEKYFYDNLELYIDFLSQNKLNLIYSSFWEGNIYKNNDNILFIDLDSIKFGDKFYDMCSILLFAYKFYNKDNTKRYEIYLYVIDLFFKKLSDNNISNFKFIKGLFLYFTFFTYIDIDISRNEWNIILKDIYINYKFTKDFLVFFEKLDISYNNE
nr:hypothetical protein [Candidatus Gracilibacteria bacterium]